MRTDLICRGVDGDVWTDRPLGSSRVVRLPTLCMWIDGEQFHDWSGDVSRIITAQRGATRGDWIGYICARQSSIRIQLRDDAMTLILDDPAGPQDDVLGRSELASAIYSLIKNAPTEWTLRVGIYGKWGEGKTTVLDLLTALAKADAVVVVRFNPSLAGSESTLWSHLLLAITDALREQANQASRKSAPLSLARLRAHITSKGDSILKIVEEAPKYGKVLSRFADLAGDPLWSRIRISPEEISQLLNEELRDRRLIIVVDDVDRLEPALVPRLLLTFRDIDMPSAAFIIAVDPDVVTQGLHAVHPGWKDAPEFLEKILQFHYWLTPPDDAALLRLARQQIPETTLDIPIDVLNEIVMDLPRNPRKLKEFFRSLWQIAPVVKRHRQDHIEWMLLLLLELLRAEAPLQVNSLLARESFRDHLASSMFFAKTSDDAGQTRNQDDLSNQLTAVLGGGSQELRGRLLAVIKRIGNAPLATAETIEYWANLRERPPALTLKEAQELHQSWRRDPTERHLSALLQDHAKRIHVGLPRAARTLFQRLLTMRHQAMSNASDSDVLVELRAAMAEADSLLQIIATMIEGSHIFADSGLAFDVDDFMRLCHHCVTWAHFTNTDEYKSARARERELLLTAGRDAAGIAPDILNRLASDDPMPGREEEAEELRDALKAVLIPFVVADVQKRFERPEGIVTLRGFTNLSNIQTRLLMNPEAGLYTPEFVQRLHALAAAAGNDTSIQKNFIEMIRRIAGASERGGPLDDAARRRFERIARLLPIFWAGAIASPIQPRLLGSLNEDINKINAAFKEFGVRLGLPRLSTLEDTAADTRQEQAELRDIEVSDDDEPDVPGV